MHTPPRLIAELIAVTTANGGSVPELARELGVDETTLMQYRSGRRALSMKSYARIMKRFAENRFIRDLAIGYATVEYHAEPAPNEFVAPEDVPHDIALALRQFAERFAEESIRGGRGLFLVASDRALSAATQFAGVLFDAAKVPMCRLMANKKPTAGELRDGLAAPLLIMQRVDFVSEQAATLICKRADLLRPMIVTSTRRPEAISDSYLRRVLTAATRLVISENCVPALDVNSPRPHATT